MLPALAEVEERIGAQPRKLVAAERPDPRPAVEVEITHDPIFSQLSDEINSVYDFDSIPFERGDVVLDIGAHKGGISCYLAKRWGAVLAFEPVPENFVRMCANIELNGLADLVLRSSSPSPPTGATWPWSTARTRPRRRPSLDPAH